MTPGLATSSMPQRAATLLRALRLVAALAAGVAGGLPQAAVAQPSPTPAPPASAPRIDIQWPASASAAAPATSMAETLPADPVAAASATAAHAGLPGVHLGTSTCGNSTCHGSRIPLPGSPIEQNEYLVWSQHDRHAKSFAALRSDQGKRIAANLGIASAERAPECLGCHADNVAVSLRGQGFRLEDGVGCEACHGGSASWLGIHASGVSTHAQNVAAGMFPTDDPTARAGLCLDCHQFKAEGGSQHRIYAAGHPRLAFELDTYSEERPAHHRIDADYRRRKPGALGARAWLLGQAATGRRVVDRLLATGDAGLWPDYAVFDCAGCHRGFGNGEPGTGGVAPLQDASISLTATSLRALRLPQAQALDDAQRALAASLKGQGGEGWRAAARGVQSRLADAERALRARSEQDDDARRLFAKLLTEATAGGIARHHLAEQVSHALATLRQADPRLAGANPAAVTAAFDALFEAGGSDAVAFDPNRYRAAAQQLAAALPTWALEQNLASDR